MQLKFWCVKIVALGGTMITKTIDLYDYFNIEKPKNAKGFLTLYVHESFKEFSFGRVRPAVLVLPGGGYAFCSNREGECIALNFLSDGYNAFVLDYSVSPVGYPYQLLEADMAMIYIRQNACELNVDKNSVCAIGFSAGGHLCSTLATIWDEKEIKDILADKVELARPDAVILSYPVITLNEYTHQGTSENVSLGMQELKDRLSTQNRVNKNSAPAFIWTTADDAVVPSENSFMMAMAYKKAGVPFELHIFETGVHGISLATKETSTTDRDDVLVKPELAKWTKLCKTWLNNRGFNIKHPNEN